MRLSVVVPLWNGAEVISECLRSVFADDERPELEVICVDNASEDDSRRIVTQYFPQVRVIPQPVNLGFAGGVNVGIRAATGDVFLLLNQDCVLHRYWQQNLREALDDYPQYGILGGTLFNADGSVNHRGAYIRYPDIYGEHITDRSDEAVVEADYVTGALFALRRQTWDRVGDFDAGFYPAYYEESDYCLRARMKGIGVACAPAIQATHLFSSRAWQRDPLRYTANQHRSRYRFVCKHLDSQQFQAFLAAESNALTQEKYLVQSMARFLAARDTMRGIEEILGRRCQDLGDIPSQAQERQLLLGFTEIVHCGLESALHSIMNHSLASPDPAQRADGCSHIALALQSELGILTDSGSGRHRIASFEARLESIKQREYELLRKIHFRMPSDTTPESRLHRFWRLFVMRPLSFLIGRDYLLQSELNAVHVARMDLLLEAYEALRVQFGQQMALLELLTEYEYR